jgi:hypothetical protein
MTDSDLMDRVAELEMRATRIIPAREGRQRREQEKQQRRDRVVAEFGANPQIMADEILRLRAGLAQLGRAIDWLKRGAPCILIPPGPYWKPKSEDADVHDPH